MSNSSNENVGGEQASSGIPKGTGTRGENAPSLDPRIMEALSMVPTLVKEMAELKRSVAPQGDGSSTFTPAAERAPDPRIS